VIFVTVGSQTPFDRLVRAVDTWARKRGVEGVRAQVGDGNYWPQHLDAVRELSPDEFRSEVMSAQLVVAHAGMGTVLTALELEKPLLLFPRRGDLRETRNYHQVATARKLAERPGIRVAFTEAELHAALDVQDSSRPQPIRPFADPALLSTVRDFLESARVGRR
jgi:UDP-N-acetylglucosamine transferase subunit ALG13